MAKKKTKKAPPAKKPDEKQKRKEAVSKAVWKATEASRTTIGKLAALVDVWDENDQLAEELKEQIGGLKGQISEDKAEMRSAAREIKSKDADVEKLGKRIGSLEGDLERRELKLAGLNERRAGAREAMKCAMADVRKIVKDGPGLFDDGKPQEEPAGKAQPAESPSATSNAKPTASSNGTSPHTSKRTKPASSKPQDTDRDDMAAGDDDDVRFQTELNKVTVESVAGNSWATQVKDLKKAGIITLKDWRDAPEPIEGIPVTLIARINDKVVQIRQDLQQRLEAVGAATR